MLNYGRNKVHKYDLSFAFTKVETAYFARTQTDNEFNICLQHL